MAVAVSSIIGAIAMGAGAAAGGVGFGRNKKNEQAYQDQAGTRGDRAQEGMQGAYEQTYGDLSQSLFDQSLNQQMTLARSGGSAGSQAAGQQSAINMAPQTAQQAGLAAHQGALGYADQQRQYEGMYGRQDAADYQLVEGSQSKRSGALGGGLTQLGVGMMSDERTKNFNKRVGKDIGTPESYGDIPVSDKRAKELEGEVAQLKQQNAQQQSNAQAVGQGLRTVMGGEAPQASSGNPAQDAGAALKGAFGGQPAAQPAPVTPQPAPQAAAPDPALQARVSDPYPTGPGGVQIGNQAGQLPAAIASQANAPMSPDEIAMTEQIQAAQADELIEQHNAAQDAEQMAFADWAREQGVNVPGSPAGYPKSPGQPKPAPKEEKAYAIAERSSEPGVTAQQATQEALALEPPPPYVPEAQAYDPGMGFGQSDEARSSMRDTAMQDYQEPAIPRADNQSQLGAEREYERTTGKAQAQYEKDLADWEWKTARAASSGSRHPHPRPKPPSDERSKNAEQRPQDTASSIFEKTPGSSFSYKPEFQGAPGADAGEHYGIMAQDLEQTPEGATMVEEDEMGLKRVDTDRLSMANSAAINEILQRLRSLDGGQARG